VIRTVIVNGSGSCYVGFVM